MEIIDLATIMKLTQEFGESWATSHARRLIKLIGQIGDGMDYDLQIIQWAAYLHDWGAYPKYYQPGCDHALLSKQIAESEVLPYTHLAKKSKKLILEAIEFHDYRDQRKVKSKEALLLREADFLDFLGAIGIAREYARGPKDVQKSYQVLLSRKELIKNRFTIPLARSIAEERLARMDIFLKDLLEESFGIL